MRELLAGACVPARELAAGATWASFILIPMSAHQRADERIADLVAQEFGVFRVAYVQIMVGRACLAPAATRPRRP